MKYSRTALRELTRLYRAVLLAAVIGTVAIAGTAKADWVGHQDKITNGDGSIALIFNESDGGGAKYTNATAGIVSFVGVNSEGADQSAVDVQIYSKNSSTNVGARLNANPTGIYYSVGDSSVNTAATELVTVGTVATKATFDSTADYTDGTVGKAIKDLTTVAYSGTNYLDSVTTLTGADAALDTQIKANADAIATLNGDASTAGSVAKSIADALANSQNPYQTETQVAATTAATVKSDAEDADFTPASSSTVLANEKTIGGAINTLGGAVDTINTNVSTISTNVGAVSDFTSSGTGNISNSAPGEGTNATTTSAAIANIDATIGQIHSLASTIDTTEGSGNLEQGSTVSGHLLALAGAIGDRSDYTGANYLTNNQDIADSLVTLDGALGDVEDIVDNHNTSLNAIAQLVDGGSVDATGTYTAGEALTAYDSATTLTGVVNKLETKKQDSLVIAADSGLKLTGTDTLSVLAGAGMEVTTAGVGIKAAGVGTDMLGAKVVTTEKIDDGAVTLIKLGTDVATTTAATGDTKLITSGGVYDIANVASAGTYIAAGTAVGSNLSLLDTAVKANADAIDTKAGLDDDNVFSGTNTFGSTTGSQVIIGNNGTITADGKTQLTQIGSSGEYALTVEQDGSTGHVTVNGGLEVSEDVAIDGTLDVGGNFMVDGTTGDTTVGGALDVTGAATFGDTLDVAGNTTVGGDLTVSGTTTLADTTVGGDFAVTGDTLLADTTVDGALDVTGNASVDGDFLVSGDTLLQNTLEVTGATTLNSTLDVASDTTIGGALDITGLTTFGTDGFNLGGNTADAIDTDGSAVAAGTTTTLATAATIKLGAGSADYTPTATDSNITKTTLAGGLDDLDAAIGVRTYTNEYNITSDDDVATSLDDLDTIIGDIANVTNTNGNITGNDIAEKLDTIDTNMGDLATMDHAAFGGAPADITSGVNALATNVETATGGTFAADGSWAATVAPAAANSYAYTESANIMDAINQVAGNVGTAAELTTAGTNGVAVANSVNANIDAVNTKLGDIDGIANANGNVGGADVAAKLDSVDAAIGDLAAAQASSQYIEPGQDIASSLSTLDGSLARVEHDLGRLENEVRGGFAAAAAMSALVPNARAAGDTQIAVGTGNYRDRVGFALGAFHYINDNILVNAGAAYGGSKSTTFRAGVTFGW